MSEEIRLTPKLFVRRSQKYEHYLFYCPGCQEVHPFCTKNENRSSWVPWIFNGDINLPTFTPSLLLKRNLSDYPGCGPRCHSVVTDGKIHFCPDCEHDLAGKTVNMIDFPMRENNDS
jgi:hypothetical protein